MAENSHQYNVYTPENSTGINRDEILDFLVKHLDEYGDKREDIA